MRPRFEHSNTIIEGIFRDHIFGPGGRGAVSARALAFYINVILSTVAMGYQAGLRSR